MYQLVKDLWLAVLLISGAIAVLLLSDLEQRNRGHRVSNKSLPPMGIMQTTTTTLFDEQDAGNFEPITFDFATLGPDGPLPATDVLIRADRFLNLGSHRGGPVRVAMVTLIENITLEEAARAVEEGLQESGLVAGTDYTLKSYSAQGEIGMLPQLLDAVIRKKPDLIISITTPALMAMAAKTTNIPVVFTVASDPKKLGLFKHGRPGHICGVHDNPPVDLLVDMARQYDSDLSAVGIVYDASLVNSLISVEMLRKAGHDRQIRPSPPLSSSGSYTTAIPNLQNVATKDWSYWPYR